MQDRAMPSKVERLSLAYDDGIAFHFVHQRVSGLDTQFVAYFLGKGDLAFTCNSARHRHFHRTLVTLLRQGSLRQGRQGGRVKSVKTTHGRATAQQVTAAVIPRRLLADHDFLSDRL